jgi:hypothetical protein
LLQQIPRWLSAIGGFLVGAAAITGVFLGFPGIGGDAPAQDIARIAVTPLPFQSQPTPTGAARVPDLQFNKPADIMTRCNIYTGSGRIPPDQELLVFDRGLDGPTGQTDQGFSLYDPAIPDKDGWHTTPMGEGADYVEVTAVLVPKSFWDFIRTIDIVDEAGRPIAGASWHSGVLPPGVRVPSLIVHLDLNTPSCP